MYVIEYGEEFLDRVKDVPAYQRRKILDTIEEQLRQEPDQETRNKKILIGVTHPWKSDKPLWELRVGEYRVFYDVDEFVLHVVIHSVRHKPPHKTTEEIL